MPSLALRRLRAAIACVLPGARPPDAATTHDVRTAAALIGVIAVAFGATHRHVLPAAPWLAVVMVVSAALLFGRPTRTAAGATLLLALAGLGLAVHWTLQARVAGGHLVLAGCATVWCAQRAFAALGARPAA